MNVSTRRAVVLRAKDRCEYCRMPQQGISQTLHVEHIVASQHRGSDSLDNLALACNRCNFHKGTNLVSVDPQTGEIVRLYHPRETPWEQHFTLVGAEILGTTPTGRATVELLQMNEEKRFELRSFLIENGDY